MKHAINLRTQVKDAVKSSGKTIPEVAKEAGINHATLYRFLHGESEMTSNNLEKVMNVLEQWLY